MPRSSEPPISLAIPLGTAQAAALLQMSAPKLIALTHQGIFRQMRNGEGIPVRGKYALNEVVASYVWFLTHEKEHAFRNHFDEARARRALASAAVSEMRVKKMSAELIETEPALEAVNSLVMRFRSKVMGVLGRIARECYGAASAKDAQEKCENLAGEIFAELRLLKTEDLEAASLRVLPESDGEESEN
jgi:hypothetical protein